MSTQTFRRRLMAVTGESPKAFISAIQMELAAKLLKDHPDMTISQIANRRIAHPTDVLKLHQHVTVRVLEVDRRRQRISLSMKGI